MTEVRSPFPTLQMHHFSIAVQNIDESIRWYSSVLGMQLERQGSFDTPEFAGRNAFLVRDGVRVELWSVQGGAGVPDGRRSPISDLATGGTKHVAFEVRELQGLLCALVELGVDIATVQRSARELHLPEDHPELSDRGAFAAFIRDPDGALIELVDPSRRSVED
ncbi:VOC family protein [Amycolatopsis pigmentata]|uniref:VOC family protein n=1 Tax=Amycolatopsis pigmentata TaxID=450801 RepID=A0ABW5FLJ3_9PSEU